MIREREIVMRDEAGVELVLTAKVDYDAEIVRTKISRRSPPGYELPLPRGFCRNGCDGCSSIESLDFGSLAEERSEFQLDDESERRVERLVGVGATAGFSVVSDERTDYPNGTQDDVI